MARSSTKTLFSLATFAIIFSQLAHLTSASPTPFTIEITPTDDHSLLPRQAGTYDGMDDDGTGRPGAHHCFKGGEWRAQEELISLSAQACTNQNINYDYTHFSYELDPDGTYHEQSVSHPVLTNCRENLYGPPSCEGGGGSNMLEMTAQFKSPKHANEVDCLWAMKRIVDICHGKNQDSRGGWWQFSDDQSTYKIDPNSIVDSKIQKA